MGAVIVSLEIIDCVQRSDAWFAARRGMLTASVVGSLVTPTLKVANNDTSRGVIAGLVAERVTGEVEQSGYMGPDVERGVLYEPVIRDRYAEVTGQTVTEVGFMIRTLPGGARLGCSPDGLVGDDGGLEIKAPRAKGQVQTILADAVPPQYVAQVQASLLVTQRSHWDYCSAAAGRLYVTRIHPDPSWHEAITEAVINAERLIQRATSDYLERVDNLATIDPYVSPYDLDVVI